MNRIYMKTGLVAVLVMVLIISPVCAQSGNLAATGNINIKITGSSTVLPIAEECASAYIANNPGSQIDVSGGGSSHGIQAVTDGTVDIGTASRDMKDSECSGLVATAIAWDSVAIVVNPANTAVADLTMGQLQDIYTGTITNWADVGGTDSPIVVVSREDGSGTRDCFEQAVLKPISGVLVGTAVIKNSNAEMRTAVAGDVNAIGYLSLGYVDTSVVSVVDIVGGEKISRTLYMITNGAPSGDEQAFLDFVRSDNGQQIVVNKGYIPLVSAENGNIDGFGGCGNINMDDVVYLARHYFFLQSGMFPENEIIYADGDIDCSGAIDMDDVVYLARHYFFLESGMFPENENLYPCI